MVDIIYHLLNTGLVAFCAYSIYFDAFLYPYLDQGYLAYGLSTYSVLIELIRTYSRLFSLIFASFDQISTTSEVH